MINTAGCQKFIRTALLVSIIAVSLTTQAAGPIETTFKKFDNWLSSKTVAANTLEATLLLLEQNPRSYQIHVRDLIKGDVYCDIQTVSIDKSSGWVAIDFDYRGGTRVSLKPVQKDSFAMRGSYRIDIPVLGRTDVAVNLTFNADGTARGKWENMGTNDAFDVIKKY